MSKHTNHINSVYKQKCCWFFVHIGSYTRTLLCFHFTFTEQKKKHQTLHCSIYKCFLNDYLYFKWTEVGKQIRNDASHFWIRNVLILNFQTITFISCFTKHFSVVLPMLPLWNFLFSSNEQKTKINAAQGGVSFNGVICILTTGMTWVTPSPLSMTVPVSVLSPTCLDVQEAARASTACHAHKHTHGNVTHFTVCSHFSSASDRDTLLWTKHGHMITWYEKLFMLKLFMLRHAITEPFKFLHIQSYSVHIRRLVCVFITEQEKKRYIKSILSKIHFRISSFALCWTESHTEISVSVWARHTGTDTC